MLSLGCGKGGADSASGSDASTGGDGAGPSDAGAWSPVCPTTFEAGLGTPCPSSAQSDAGPVYCEYGYSWWNVGCDQLLACAGGVWKVDTLYGSETCSPAPSGANPAACPSDPSAIVDGSNCSAFTDAGPPGGVSNTVLGCYWGQGAGCECGYFHGPDAGVTWSCSPSPGCPIDRPRLGSPCSGNTHCGYWGGCSGYEEWCLDGVWTVTEPGCP